MPTVPYSLPNSLAPEDDQPKYDNLAQVLAGQGQSLAPPPGGPQQTAAPQQAPSAPNLLPLPLAPQAPVVDQAARQKLLGTLNTDAKAPDRKQYSPHWWERLAGAGEGFAVGFGGGAGAGIAAGSAITNRRYNRAVDDQQGRVAADRQALDQFDQGNQAAVDQYSKVALPGFQAERERVNDTNRGSTEAYEHALAQGNADRTFGLSQQEFGQQQTRDAQAAKDAAARQGATAAEQAEIARHNRAQEGLDAKRIAVDAADTGEKRNEAVALKRQQDLKALEDQRDTSLDEIDMGTKLKDGTHDLNGYEGRKAAIMKKPLTGTGLFGNHQAYTQADKDSELQALDKQREAQRNAVLQGYNERVATINGAPSKPVAVPGVAQPSGDSVRVQRPDGSIVRIPKQNLPAALKLGGKAL